MKLLSESKMLLNLYEVILYFINDKIFNYLKASFICHKIGSKVN